MELNGDTDGEMRAILETCYRRFIGSNDDAVGQAALSLALQQIISGSPPEFQKFVAEKIRQLPDQTISQVYVAAANRLFDAQSAQKLEGSSIVAVSESALYLKIKSAVDDHFSFSNKELNELRRSTSFGMQTVVASIAGIVIGLFVVIANQLPGAFSYFGKTEPTSVQGQQLSK